MINLQPSAVIVRALVMFHTSGSDEQWASGKRTKHIVKGKRILAWIARYKLDMSYPAIAELCNWTSHDSSYSAVRHVEQDANMIDIAESIYDKAATECNE